MGTERNIVAEAPEAQEWSAEGTSKDEEQSAAQCHVRRSLFFPLLEARRRIRHHARFLSLRIRQRVRLIETGESRDICRERPEAEVHAWLNGSRRHKET